MASGQWWVIAYTQVSGSTTYQYFQGTKAQAEAQANLAVKVGGSNLTGPYATEADAEAAVKAGKVNKGDQSQAQQTVSAAASGLQDVLGLPTLSNLRDLMIRVMKVVVGAALVIIGVAELTGVSKEAIPVIGAAAKVIP